MFRFVPIAPGSCSLRLWIADRMMRIQRWPPFVGRLYPFAMKNVLVVDIGGTHVKVASSEQRVPIKIVSGSTMNAVEMARQVLAATKNWKYDCISMGYPGPVINDHPLAEPH